MSAVMIIYHDVFPTSYLLALAPTAAATAEAKLAAHLACACRSGKPAVWVDCRLLDTLSATAAWLLWACQQRLHRRHARLVLCQVPAAVERALRSTLAGTGAHLLIVPTLDDAAALS
jgi:anti-anti-sigma regulatory factor